MIATMKRLFSNSIQPLPRIVMLSMLSIIAISIACSGYKSAGSQPLTNANAQPQPAAQTNPVSPVNAKSQDRIPCTLKMASAPDLNGLRLGMTPAEVLALFPGSSTDAEVQSSVARPPSKLGASGFVIMPSKYGSKEKFAAIKQITFITLDGRVSGFTAGYNGPEFSDIDKFIARFIQGTKLSPVESWEPEPGLDTTLKFLKCADFEVRLFIGGAGGNLNYAEFRDLNAEKIRVERREKARAQAKPTP